jgi:PAS domain S-box-containing protein
MEKDNFYRLINLMMQIKMKIGSNSQPVLDKLDEWPVGIALINSQGVFETANSQFCQDFQYKKREITGKHFSLIFPPQRKNFCTKLHQKIIDTQQSYAGKLQVIDRDQNIFETLSTIFFVQAEQKRPQVMITLSACDDFRALEARLLETLSLLNKYISRLQQELEASEAAKKLLMKQLRLPLASIMEMTQELQAHKYEGEELNEWLELIQNASQSTYDLLDRFTCLQRIAMGDFNPKYEAFDLMNLLEEANNKYMLRLKTKDLKVQVKLDGQLCDFSQKCKLHADRTFMEMMLSNLLIFAIDASPKKGIITLEIEHLPAENDQEPLLRFSIHNFGVVPVEEREVFFDKFNDLEKGTGLETYIARSVAEAHDGTISINSSQEEGTTITVTLPVLTKPRIRIQDLELRRDILGGGKKQI